MAEQSQQSDQQLSVYRAARQEAQRVLDSFGRSLSYPVDLETVSQLLNARMRYDSQLGEISGLIIKNPGQPAEILINSLDSAARHRFTWAHELGHLAERTTLAKDFEYSFVDLRKPGNYSLHEFYADEFAGSLLMPSRTIRELEAQGKGSVEMAQFFGVSPAAMNMRLHRLSVVPDES